MNLNKQARNKMKRLNPKGSKNSTLGKIPRTIVSPLNEPLVLRHYKSQRYTLSRDIKKPSKGLYGGPEDMNGQKAGSQEKLRKKFGRQEL